MKHVLNLVRQLIDQYEYVTTDPGSELLGITMLTSPPAGDTVVTVVPGLTPSGTTN